MSLTSMEKFRLIKQLNELKPKFHAAKSMEKIKILKEIKEIKADTVITSCPGCKSNMWGPARENGVEILDLAEFVNKLI